MEEKEEEEEENFVSRMEENDSKYDSSNWILSIVDVDESDILVKDWSK